MAATILIAEQEPETRTFLKTLLEREGYLVCLSVDADSAIRQAEAVKPALIIIDALLPGDGAARLIRQYEHLPVIVTSAIPMKTLFFRHSLFGFLFHPGESNGPVPFLEKPVQEDELFQLVHSLITNRAAKQPSQGC
ncbi:MAG: response regulator [Pseudomonadota bacterium]